MRCDEPTYHPLTADMRSPTGKVAKTTILIAYKSSSFVVRNRATFADMSFEHIDSTAFESITFSRNKTIGGHRLLASIPKTWRFLLFLSYLSMVNNVVHK